MTSLAHLKAYIQSPLLWVLTFAMRKMVYLKLGLGWVWFLAFSTPSRDCTQSTSCIWHFHSTASTVWLTGSVNGSVSLLMTLDITMICGPQVVTTGQCVPGSKELSYKTDTSCLEVLSLYEKINSFNYTSTKILGLRNKTVVGG